MPVHFHIDYTPSLVLVFFFFSSRRRHTRLVSDWSSDVCSSDLIYLIGGRITANNIGGYAAANVDVVEEYTPATDSWRAMNRMPTPRSGQGWTTYQDKIYVAGGEHRDYHIEGPLRDVEVFDPAANDWYRLPSMPTARHGVNVAAYNGKLFVIGGHLVFAGGGGHALDANNNEVLEFGGAAPRSN